jgi:hypothetical protein
MPFPRNPSLANILGYGGRVNVLVSALEVISTVAGQLDTGTHFGLYFLCYRLLRVHFTTAIEGSRLLMLPVAFISRLLDDHGCPSMAAAHTDSREHTSPGRDRLHSVAWFAQLHVSQSKSGFSTQRSAFRVVASIEMA